MSDLPQVQFDHYYLHAELSEHLRKVAAAAPDRVRLHNLYTTPEGREEWLVEVTAPVRDEPAYAESVPAYLVHANLHAPEVSGTTAALVLLDRLLQEDCRELLSQVSFHLIPRLNPDGAEYALATGGNIRSKFQPRPRKNGLHAQDLNGDGNILQMRWEDPYGPYRLDEEDPRIMVARKPGDEGPFYQMAQEGLIEDYDGGPIADAIRGFDFNRNWGYNWQPEHLQWGAGDYAFSNPEMKAVADWVYSHPGIFGMLGFHNGCNAVLRPSATAADDQINGADLRAMREIGQLGERLTGFGLRAVRDYRGPDAPPLSLKGHFTDWGYLNLGLLVFEIELGNLYNSAGITTKDYFGADELTRDGDYRRRIMRHADTLPHGNFVDWQAFEHPQLGPVEIGGLPIVTLCTPPAPELEGIGGHCADFILKHARRHPQLEVRDAQAERLTEGVYRLRARVVNTGGLPTQVTHQGLKIANNGPVTVRLELPEGTELLSRQQVIEVAGLEPLRGFVDVEWFVRAEPEAVATIIAHAPKAGRVDLTIRMR
jgi:hypothetical protein